jgi:hypothetical protein
MARMATFDNNDMEMPGISHLPVPVLRFKQMRSSESHIG